MNELTNYGNRRMTTAEVCVALGCDRTTLMRNWHDIESCAGAAQVKKIENGKATFWTETEVTLLLEKMKGNANNQHTLQENLEGVETAQSLDLPLALVERKAHELWKRKALEQEARAVKAELELLSAKRLLDSRGEGLETYQRIAEASGLSLSDRDDVLGTYRRRA